MNRDLDDYNRMRDFSATSEPAAKRPVGDAVLDGISRHWQGREQALAQMQLALKAEHREIRRLLIGMARALQSGSTERLQRSVEQPPGAGGAAGWRRGSEGSSSKNGISSKLLLMLALRLRLISARP